MKKMSCRGGRPSGSDQPQVRRHSGLNLEGRSHGVGKKLVISHGHLIGSKTAEAVSALHSVKSMPVRHKGAQVWVETQDAKRRSK